MGDEPLPDGVRRKMGDALRLHAIAVSNAQRAQSQLQGELTSLHEAKEKLRTTRLQGAAGPANNCDVRG